MPKKAGKQAANVDALVDHANNERVKKRIAAKELRIERKLLHKNLTHGFSPNRNYTATIPGAKLYISWHNGVQRVSIEHTNDNTKREVEEVTVSLPTKKMTWKNLRAEVVAGNSVYTRQGKKIPCTKRAEVMPHKEVKVTIEEVGKNKIYRIT